MKRMIRACLLLLIAASAVSAAVLVPVPHENLTFNGGGTIFWSGCYGATVDIDLYRAGVYMGRVADGAANDGQYAWTVPGTYSYDSLYTIKVSSAADPSGYNGTSSFFTATTRRDPAVMLPSPFSAWKPGTSDTVAWDPAVITGSTVSISLYRGSALIRTVPAIGNTGIYVWSVSASEPEGERYKILVRSEADSSQAGVSVYFSVRSGPNPNSAFIITEPEAGDVWSAGISHMIRWDSNVQDSSVSVALYNGDDFLEWITDSTGNDGRQTVVISNAWVPGYHYRLLITGLTSGAFGFSDSIRVNTSPAEVKWPHSGTTWKTDDDYHLSWAGPWNMDTLVSVSLYYQGVFQEYITESTPNTGRYYLDDIPDHLVTDMDYNYRVRVTSISNPSLYMVSDSFRVEAIDQIKVLSPDTASIYTPGSIRTVLWNNVGTVGNTVTIRLFRDGGGSYGWLQEVDTLAENISNTGRFLWMLSAGLEESNMYKVLVRADDATYAYSNYFSISPVSTPTLHMEFPAAGAVLHQGLKYKLQWWRTGTLNSTVSLALYKNGQHLETIAGGEADDGIYDWRVPGYLTPGGDYAVRVRNDNDTACAAAGEIFTIVSGHEPTIFFTTPDSSYEYFKTLDTLRWISDPSQGTLVRLELYCAGIYYTLIGDSIPNTGEYIWHVPASMGVINQVTCMIRSLSDPGIYGISPMFAYGGNIPPAGPGQIRTNVVSSGTGSAGGTITPSVSVDAGEAVTIYITPDSGFTVDEVWVNGNAVGAVTSWVFEDIRYDQSITATFRPGSGMAGEEFRSAADIPRVRLISPADGIYGTVFLSHAGMLDIRLSDGAGITVCRIRKQVAAGRTPFRLDVPAPGIYFLAVEGEAVFLVKKVLIINE